MSEYTKFLLLILLFVFLGLHALFLHDYFGAIFSGVLATYGVVILIKECPLRKK